MNERRQDFELLQRFTRDGEQSAFADVVRRYLDLVFATALRKVGESGGAQEISQNVFSALARKAWRFAPDDSLPAWLYKAALLESKSWLRGELGRRRREATAAELGTTMKTSEAEPAFHALVPLLDEALLSLREKDRTALLLRFYGSHSLREVGAAFGVSEDTAQKRVQSALEKMAEFFNRHGIKTATVAASAAAMQHTAASASTAMVNTVVGAALKIAPPALVGLTALLARLASMSRVQTAAVCVALAAVPAAWQLNERHAAGEVVKRLQAQRFTAQTDAANLQAELTRAQAEAARLEQSVAKANQATAQAAATAQAFAAWKQKMRSQLSAPDYRWSDDSAFVRIPKAILPQLSEWSGAEPFSSPGVVHPFARELMGLTSAETQAIETLLQHHFAEVEQARAAGVNETNRPALNDPWPGGHVLAARDFSALESGDELKQRADRLLTELRGLAGEERWPIIDARFKDPRAGASLSATLAGTLALDPVKNSDSVQVLVGADNKGTLLWFASGGNGSISFNSGGVLAEFLPEGDPAKTSDSGPGGWALLSDAVRQRAAGWLQKEALARLGKKDSP